MTINDNPLDQAILDELTPKPNGEGTSQQGSDGGDKASVSENQENQGSETQTFQLPDGRMVTPSEAQRLWKEEFMPDYTKKSQELSQLKKEPADKQSTKEEKPDGNEDSELDQATLKEFGRYAKRLGLATKDDLDTVVPRASGATLAQIQLDKALTELETDFDGSQDATLGVAKPKVNRAEIMEYVQGEIKKGNKVNLSPLQVAHLLHPNEFALFDAATLNKGSQGTVETKPALPVTEKGGASGGGNQTPPTPKFDFNDGASSMQKGLEDIFQVGK